MQTDRFPVAIFLLTALTAALIAMPLAAAETFDVLNQANELASHGQLPETIALLENARTEAEHRNDFCSEAIFLNSLGVLDQREARYLDAENAYSRSISLLTQCKGENAFELIGPQRNLANLYFEAGQLSGAAAALRRNLAILDARGAPAERTVEDLGLLAKVYLTQRKYSLAERAAEDALEASGSAPDNVHAALAYSVLGSVYHQAGNPGGAEKSFEESLLILRECLDPSDFRIGQGMANLGLLYVEGGGIEKGEPLLDQAWTFLKSNNRNTSFTRQFLASYAEVERKLGNRKKAKELSREAGLLVAQSAESAISRYIVDAGRLR
jgi:tetratricopeptide (TPR) repeat protein